MQFLKCEYNWDGDSWRSPYSNQYFPPLDEGVDDAFFPDGDLLALERTTNERLREYVHLYFGDAQANAYYFETTDTGFGSVWLIKNERNGMSGCDIS